jgi:eukaryotic-like serine/threonine-protein kinase
MTDANLVLVEALFHEAMGLELPARLMFLGQLEQSDPAMHAQLSDLLAQELESPGFLEGELRVPVDEDEQLAPGCDVGGYRILRPLGAGSMATVYEAEQSVPRRSVALKLLHPWLISPAMCARLERESEFLARLQHPGIARIYDAGVAAGQPYFAMELIAGPTVTEHAAVLPRRGQIELLARICDAVEHAHQRGVIHRDLKPANILIEQTDGDAVGQPKVLDFGVARAALPGGSGQNLTLAGCIVGTGAYMSPEQACGDADVVTERSDVYSIGAIMAHVLTGAPRHDLANASLGKSLRIIMEHDSPTLGSSDRSLRGDLSAIAACALERDPRRRYASAAELAADMRRWLRHEPLRVRPVGPAGVLAKRIRRHPLAATASISIVAGLALTAAGTSLGMLNARHEMQRTQRVLAFLEDSIAAADPLHSDQPQSVLTVIRAIAGDAGTRFAGDPGTEAAVRIAAARGLLALGAAPEAEAEAQRAIELLPRLHHRDPVLHVRAACEHARTLNALGHPQEAARVAGDAIASNSAVLRRHHPAMLDAATQLGIALLNQPAVAPDAIPLLSEALELARRHRPDDADLAARIRATLAWALYEDEQYQRSESLYRELLHYHQAQSTSRYAGSHALIAHRNLAAALWSLEHLDEAAHHAQLSLAGLEHLLPSDHPEVLTAVNIVGIIAEASGDFGLARTCYRRVLQDHTRRAGPDSRAVRIAAVNLAFLDMRTGQLHPAEALPVLSDGLLLAEDARPSQRFRLKMRYAACRLMLGEPDEADRLLTEARRGLASIFPPTHRWIRESDELIKQARSTQR